MAFDPFKLLYPPAQAAPRTVRPQCASPLIPEPVRCSSGAVFIRKQSHQPTLRVSPSLPLLKRFPFCRTPPLPRQKQPRCSAGSSAPLPPSGSPAQTPPSSPTPPRHPAAPLGAGAEPGGASGWGRARRSAAVPPEGAPRTALRSPCPSAGRKSSPAPQKGNW